MSWSSKCVILYILYWSIRHIRRRTSFGSFCASAVTCPRQPISFSLLLYVQTPCEPPAFLCAGHFNMLYKLPMRASSPAHLIPLRPNILLKTMFTKALQMCYSHCNRTKFQTQRKIRTVRITLQTGEHDSQTETTGRSRINLLMGTEMKVMI
jgi:hypothetical protein